MNESPIIEVRNLSKQFKETKALDNINLDILPGRIIGLLGANGGGKSTLLRHLIGLYLPSDGSCRTFGCEARDLGAEEMSRIGYVHQEGELLGWMTVEQLIRYVAAYYPSWNSQIEQRYLNEFEMDTKARVGSLSPGKRQQLAVLLAIGFEPELLILDEPAAGLDPIARRQFLDMLLDIIQQPGRTILISSHILSDVEKVIDHVLIMDHGHILRDCALDDLREEFCQVRLTSISGDALPDTLPFANVLHTEQSGSMALLTMKAITHEEMNTKASSIGARAEILPMNLEDLYRLVVEKKEGK